MFKKALIAAAVAAFVPVAAANAAPAFNHQPSHAITIAKHDGYHFGHRDHGPRIVYKTVFQTKKIVKIVKVHGRYVKVVRYVTVPVKIAFINGKPVRM